MLLAGAAAANDLGQPQQPQATYPRGVRATTTYGQPNVRVVGRPTNTPHTSTAQRPLPSAGTRAR